ncbi:uncharacterized protein LOC127719945 [Mytilus californianus]|uniref:uncharacterized protein LOC127719945 n=1 Tax=Mytilus californianus TaxID=6549 RepID=UPI002245B01D|nr:uncharacterized protein LOC127719945 [Mytilus californianus]
MDDMGNSNDERQKTFLLITCLNLNGASKDMINYRISCFKAMEGMYSIANLERSPMRGYFIGSQIEGTTLIGSESDEDIMFVNEDITVICETDRHEVDQLGERLNRFHSTQIKSNIPIGVILESEETPGYVKIRVVDAKTYNPLTECDTNPISHLCYTDSKGFLLLSTEKLKTRIGTATSERYRNGPAMTETSTKEFHSSDLVYGLFTKAWPKSADEWLSRKRRYPWPPTNITKLVYDGCFLVPTGSSYESETIWRLSFVQIEKEMVWAWSAIQYKCFMLLKLIKRSIIQPAIPDVISSYQLKTIMFWVSEETDPMFWKTNNIRECFTRCFEFLLEYVQKENCPHYFVRTNNLFRGKLNRSLKEELICLLFRILQNFWTEVFKIPSLREVSENLEEGEIERYGDVLTATMRHPELLKEIMNLYFSVIISFATSAMKPAFKFLRKNDIDVAIKRHHEYRLLIARFSLTDPEHLELEQLINRLIDISLGSQLNSKACKTEDNIEKTKLIHEAEMLFKRGINLDTASGRLKLATLYFCQGKYRSVCNLIKEVSTTEGVFQLNGFEPQSPDISFPYALRIISEQPSLASTLRDHAALELVFLPSEINSAPDPIKFEINRAVLAENECSLDNPLSWAAFDADFYTLLLKFLILHEQNAYQERNETLSKLREYVKKTNSFYRRISAMNIVGYCLQLVGEVQWALDVFLGSLVL